MLVQQVDSFDETPTNFDVTALSRVWATTETYYAGSLFEVPLRCTFNFWTVYASSGSCKSAFPTAASSDQCSPPRLPSISRASKICTHNGIIELTASCSHGTLLPYSLSRVSFYSNNDRICNNDGVDTYKANCPVSISQLHLYEIDLSNSQDFMTFVRQWSNQELGVQDTYIIILRDILEVYKGSIVFAAARAINRVRLAGFGNVMNAVILAYRGDPPVLLMSSLLSVRGSESHYMEMKATAAIPVYTGSFNNSFIPVVRYDFEVRQSSTIPTYGQGFEITEGMQSKTNFHGKRISRDYRRNAIENEFPWNLTPETPRFVQIAVAVAFVADVENSWKCSSGNMCTFVFESIIPPAVQADQTLLVVALGVLQRVTCLSELSRWFHVFCCRTVSIVSNSIMALVILLGASLSITLTFHRWIILSRKVASAFHAMTRGIGHILAVSSHSTIPRRPSQISVIMIVITIMQSLLIDGASFTTKAIGQSTPMPGATNRMTVTLISDSDLRASDSLITISGLEAAIAASPIPLLDLSDGSEMIFSDGTAGGQGVWKAGTLTIKIISGAILSAGTIYILAFDVTNPATANTSPTIYVEASGTTSIASSPMTVPNLTQYGVRNGMNPLQVEVPVFNTKSIQQSPAPFAGVKKWKVTLNSNYAFSSGSTVTISGLMGSLTGSPTPESTKLEVTSTDSKLGRSGDWTRSMGTLVLVVESEGTTAAMDYAVTFSLPTGSSPQVSPTAKVTAAIQDSGSIDVADITYATAEATDSIVLFHTHPIPTHRQSRRSAPIVKIEMIPTLAHHVETRAVLFPVIIAGSITPTEGPISKGSLVLLGISSATALLNLDLESSLKFRVQDKDNANNLAYGAIVAGPLSLAHWKAAESPEYVSFVQNTTNFSLGSRKLVKDYQNVIQLTKSSADDANGDVIALLAVRTPNWTGACRVQAVVEYNGHELKFDFEYWEADPFPQIESVRAQNGQASGMVAGGYSLTVSISGFSITYDMQDISILFGSGPGQAAQVLWIEQSDSNGTVICALVPPGHSGAVQVVVSNYAQGSSVYFEFEYLNDSSPEVESIAPFLAYADGSALSAIIPFELSTTFRQFRRSQEIATFGGCTFSLDDFLQLSSAGSCSATGGTLDLGSADIASLAPGVFANMPSLQ